MIYGKVTESLDAVIPLTIVGSGGTRVTAKAVIDTGFNRFLTLPSSVIDQLQLPAAGSRRATLADGSIVALDVYLANVEWHGSEREVLVIESAGGPLAGMSLLDGSRVQLDVVANGEVSISPFTPDV